MSNDNEEITAIVLEESTGQSGPSPLGPANFQPPPINNSRLLLVGIGCFAFLALLLVLGVMVGIFWYAFQSDEAANSAFSSNLPITDKAEFERRQGERYRITKNAYKKALSDASQESPKSSLEIRVEGFLTQVAKSADNPAQFELLCDRERFQARVQETAQLLGGKYSKSLVQLYSSGYLDFESYMEKMKLVRIIPLDRGQFQICVEGQDEEHDSFDVILWCVQNTRKGFLIYDYERIDLGYTESELAALSISDRYPDVSKRRFDLLRSIDQQTTDNAAPKLTLENLDRFALLGSKGVWDPYFNNLGGYYYNGLGCYERAIDLFDAALAGRQFPGACFGKAIAYQELGDFDSALKNIDLCIDLVGPSKDNLEVKLGILLNKNDRPRAFETALALNDLDPAFSYRLLNFCDADDVDLAEIELIFAKTMRDIDSCLKFVGDGLQASSPEVHEAFQKTISQNEKLKRDPNYPYLAKLTLAVGHLGRAEFEQAASVYREILADEKLSDEHRDNVRNRLLSLSPYFEKLEDLTRESIDDASILKIIKQMYYDDEGFHDVDTSLLDWLDGFLMNNPDNLDALFIKTMLAEHDGGETIELLRTTLAKFTKNQIADPQYADDVKALRNFLTSSLTHAGRIAEAIESCDEPSDFQPIATWALENKNMDSIKLLLNHEPKGIEIDVLQKSYLRAAEALLNGDSNSALNILWSAIQGLDENQIHWSHIDAIVDIVAESPSRERIEMLQSKARFRYPLVGKMKKLRKLHILQELLPSEDFDSSDFNTIRIETASDLMDNGEYERVLKILGPIPRSRQFSRDTNQIDLMRARAASQVDAHQRAIAWQNVDKNDYLNSKLKVLKNLNEEPEAFLLSVKESLNQGRDLGELLEIPEIRRALDSNIMTQLRQANCVTWNTRHFENDLDIFLWYDAERILDAPTIKAALRAQNLDGRYQDVELYTDKDVVSDDTATPKPATWIASDSEGNQIFFILGKGPITSVEDDAYSTAEKESQKRAKEANCWVGLGTNDSIGANPKRNREIDIFKLADKLFEQRPIMAYSEQDESLWFPNPGEPIDQSNMQRLVLDIPYFWVDPLGFAESETNTQETSQQKLAAKVKSARDSQLKSLARIKQRRESIKSMAEKKTCPVTIEIGTSILEALSAEVIGVRTFEYSTTFQCRLLESSRLFPYVQQGDVVECGEYEMTLSKD
ncbi:MAG: hypothetical protein ABL888_05665 [Pirellulaceae bacterium]